MGCSGPGWWRVWRPICFRGFYPIRLLKRESGGGRRLGSRGVWETWARCARAACSGWWGGRRAMSPQRRALWARTAEQIRRPSCRADGRSDVGIIFDVGRGWKTAASRRTTRDFMRRSAQRWASVRADVASMWRLEGWQNGQQRRDYGAVPYVKCPARITAAWCPRRSRSEIVGPVEGCSEEAAWFAEAVSDRDGDVS